MEINHKFCVNRKHHIDLAIERADNMTNICEMKYDSHGEYAISKDEEEKLRNRMSVYAEEMGTKNGLVLTLVTNMG